MDNNIKRMKELIDILNNASKLYYQFNTSIMTDYEYDKLYDELVDLENETNMTLSNSPTINIESEIVSSLEQVSHPSPMLSLSKTKKVDELQSFLGDKEGILSWKLDGLTIVLKYNNGHLISGVTRGNGLVGEVITENVKRFKNIPLNISYKKELVLRGEAIIKYSDFNKMNDINDPNSQFKNPRNLCSGSVRQLDSSVTEKRNVNCIIFALIISTDVISDSKMKQYEWLSNMGFEVVERESVNKNNIFDVVKKYKERIKDYDIPSDGLVLTFDSVEYSKELGTTAKYPKDSIAFKWQDQTVESNIKDIFWSVSRTGLINPVAVFDPVYIEGSIVSRASLHNLSILERLKIGINDRVEVYKANMIIPQIATNKTKSNNIIIPKKCPECSNNTIIKEINGIKYLYCTNPDCVAILMKKLSLFTSRNAMNIEGLSDAILYRFIKENLLKNFSDIYKLSDYEDMIVNYDGFGQKSFNNLIKSIEKSKKVKLANFIYSLGIPEVGLSRAKLICNHFKNDYNIIKHLTFEELNNILGVGEIIAKEWVTFFNNTDNIKESDKVYKLLNINDTTNNSDILNDLTFVITGSLNNYENRDELINYIESLGGKVVSSITNNVNYLINNDLKSNSTKNIKAQELGIKIIDEEEFLLLTKKK